MIVIGSLLLYLGVMTVEPAEQASVSPPADSQSSNQEKWELDFHVGGIGGGTFSDGSPYFPEPGAEFLTFTGVPSRRVSSWYFGDGAALLARAVQPFGLVTPLDPVLHSSVISRKPGGSVGVRLGRRLTDRVRAEISVDYNLSRLAFDDSVIRTIEGSRIGFMATFRTFPFLATSASSTGTVRDRAGREVTSIAAIAIDVSRHQKIVPFVTGGAGIISRTSGPLSIAMQGEYVLGNAAFPGRQLVEHDKVTIRYELAPRDWVIVSGGGIRYDLSPRWVGTLEGRVHLSTNSLRISVDAMPQTVPAVLSAGTAVVFGTIPPLQFANAGQNRSTLSGSPLEDFTTFQGHGVQGRLSITAGLGWRF